MASLGQRLAYITPYFVLIFFKTLIYNVAKHRVKRIITVGILSDVSQEYERQTVFGVDQRKSVARAIPAKLSDGRF